MTTWLERLAERQAGVTQQQPASPRAEENYAPPAAGQPLGDEFAPVMEWDDFYNHFTMGEFLWQQGEHVALIGSTGTGKTSLAYRILPQRKTVTILATKVKDDSLKRFAHSAGFKLMKKWPAKGENPARSPRRLLWPPIGAVTDLPNQRLQMQLTLEDIYARGSWCVYVDELYYMVNQLGLGRLIKLYLLQARSNGISLVQATQRPAWVPLETYSNSVHIFFFNTKDAVDLKRISGISSQDSFIMRDIIANLGRHEFLYVNQRTGKMIRSTAPDPNERNKG